MEDVGRAPFAMESMLASLADGVYATDRERRIVYWNGAAEVITGYSPAEVIGRTCSDGVLAHVDKDGHRLCGSEHCPLQRALVTGRPSAEPILVHARTKSGARVPTEVSVAPLRGPAGDVVGGVEVFRQVNRLYDDLRRAARIQRQTLHFDLGEDTRIRFASLATPVDHVGGDFHRVERLGDDRYVMLVADVMGHGLASALYTMQLRSLWEELREELTSPSRWLAALNARLTVLFRGEDYFVTAVCCTMDLSRGTLSYALAGHAPPLLRRAGDRDFAALPAGTGLPIGAFARATFDTRTVHLAEGDCLLLATDAVVDQQRADGRPIGEEGFIDLLRACEVDGTHAALQRVELALLRQSGSIRLTDDLTLLSVHLRPPS